jgi:uncharacterized protein (TIGR02611 family)
MGWIKKLVIGVVGFTVLAIGLVMIVIPGPAVVVIPIGLAILAIEFAWARKPFIKVRNLFKRKKKDGIDETR